MKPGKRIRLRLTLGAKFNLLTVLLILSTSAGLSFFVIRAELKNVHQEIRNQGITLAELVANQCEPALLPFRPVDLSPIVHGLALNPNIAYFRLVNRHKALLLEKHFIPGVGPVSATNPTDSKPLERIWTGKFVNPGDKREYVEVRAPVLKKTATVPPANFSANSFLDALKISPFLGEVHIGLTLEEVNRRLSDFIYATLVLTVIITILGVGATVALTRKITAPVQRLKRATQEISDGKLEGFIPAGNGDELSDLAQAFNQMLARLKKHQKQIQDRTVELTETNTRMASEIEERIRIEAVLRQSEARFRSVIETASEAVITVNQAGTIVGWNPSAETIFGFSAGEIIGRPFISIIGSTDDQHFIPDETHKILNPEEAFGHGSTFQARGLTKAGREFPAELSVASWKAKEESFLTVILRDITERRLAEEQLTYASTHDSLTQLYNRSFFEETMKLLAAEREPSVGILLLDIDGLKFVNDTLGHVEGDRQLQELAEFLKRTFRPSDLIARIGGDEFAVVIKNINRERFESAVARLKNQILSYNNALPKGRHPLNISAGYDLWDPTSQTLIEVFKSADHRMLQEKIPKREDVRKSILQVLKATMVEKDTGTEQHMSRMTELARRFAEKVGLSPEEAQKVVLATELHDIGKVVIPDEILNKKGPLTTEEFEVIKRHTETGYRIAKATPEISHVAEIILSAHERWDGRGYPQGLKGEEIPLLARMVFILDAYDVMRNDRPYRKGRTVLEAREELKNCSGSQFDPQLVDIFIAEVLPEEAS